MGEIRTAKQRALELLQTHSVQQPPVPLEAIAESAGIRVVYEELEDRISGLLVQKGEYAVIGVNSLHHPNRQRFTLAHELGHFYLHSTGPTIYVDGAMIHFRGEDFHAPATPVEVEANTFAAALLMPDYFLREDLEGRAIDAMDEAAVKRLARRYGVSQQALTIRLVELGLLRGLTAAPSQGI